MYKGTVGSALGTVYIKQSWAVAYKLMLSRDEILTSSWPSEKTTDWRRWIFILGLDFSFTWDIKISLFSQNDGKFVEWLIYAVFKIFPWQNKEVAQSLLGFKKGEKRRRRKEEEKAN